MSEDKTKDALLVAAKKLFAQNSYEGVSVKEIATEANANISAISYHFNGKEGLYYACLEDFGKARLAMAERILVPPTSLDEVRFKLQLFAEEIIGCHLEETDVCQILHRGCETDNPIIETLFQKTFMKVFEKLVDFISSAQKKKLIQTDLDPFLSASVFFSSLIHFCRSEKLREKFFDRSLKNKNFREAAVSHMVRIFIQGTKT